MGVSATTTGDAVGSMVAGASEYLVVGVAVAGRAVEGAGVLYPIDMDMLILILMLLCHPI